jgi:hypothetical protein
MEMLLECPLTPQPPLPHRGEGEPEQNRNQKAKTALAFRTVFCFWLPLSPLWERGLGGEGAGFA